MERSDWQADLSRAIADASPPERPARVAMVGIGCDGRGDEAVGLAVVRRLARHQPATWLVVDAGDVPESCANQLRWFEPELIALVDAVDFGESPGTVRWIDPAADLRAAAAHTPLTGLVLACLAGEFGVPVGLLGIQPETSVPDTELSPAAQAAVGRVDAAFAA